MLHDLELVQTAVCVHNHTYADMTALTLENFPVVTVGSCVSQSNNTTVLSPLLPHCEELAVILLGTQLHNVSHRRSRNA